MWRDHFKSLFNSVQDVTIKPGVLSYMQNSLDGENVTWNKVSSLSTERSFLLPLIKMKFLWGIRH